MSLFELSEDQLLGKVISVDTGSIILAVDKLEKLRKCQVNQLTLTLSPKPGQFLIGIINKITRKLIDSDIIMDEQSPEDIAQNLTENLVKVTLIGTFFDLKGLKRNQFRRNLDAVPEIDAECYAMEGNLISKFMSAISDQGKDGIVPLSIGRYSLDDSAQAYLNGDKLFQRHAVIVGSTGSGKSWAVAKLIEQISALPMANAILFDLHGEYSTKSFLGTGIEQFKIAGPADLKSNDKLSKKIITLPYWLLNYDELITLVLDRSDSNAPNQAAYFSKSVLKEKRNYLESIKDKEYIQSFTLDSPIPFSLLNIQAELVEEDTRMVEGAKAGSEKQGPYYGKFSRFIQRLESKLSDKRLGFLFETDKDSEDINWMAKLAQALMSGAANRDNNKGVKVIDFSEVPSDILPLVIGLVSRLIFSIQQWISKDSRHPIAIFCDEAHLYIPQSINGNAVAAIGLNTFERIAKEGRKYGISLVVISQRPSEVNHTVLSQCNNFIALRLSNVDDQAVIKKLLPDNLSTLTDVLPILDIGEALVVGDASLLPSRINIEEPKLKPESATIDFWQAWNKPSFSQDLAGAIKSLRQQTKL
jgi:uncharacterized protein